MNFRSETTGCDQPLFCTVTVSDGTLRQGQGHHGSFSRADTANFMAAIGPAFKAGFVNAAPVSNADIAPTLAKSDRRDAGAGRQAARPGDFGGAGRRQAGDARERKDVVSPPGDGGLRTIVNMQYVGIDAATSTRRDFPDGRWG